MNTPAQPALITPPPSPQEAAAIVAAIECFVRDTAPSPPPQGRATGGGWLRAARAEAVGRAAAAPSRTGGWRPWGGGFGSAPH